jgi:hypothetical protein
MAAIISFVIILVCSHGHAEAGEGSVTMYVVCFVGFWLCLGGWLAIRPDGDTTTFLRREELRPGNYGLV